MTVKGNQKTLYRQISSQFQGKRRIPFVARDHEVSHGRNITWMLRAKQAPEHIRENWIGTSWIVEVAAIGRSSGDYFGAPQQPRIQQPYGGGYTPGLQHNTRYRQGSCATYLNC